MKRQTLITIGICICFLVLSGWFYLKSSAGSIGDTQKWTSNWESPMPSSKEDRARVATDKDTANNGECAVYICGAVKNPGVYPDQRSDHSVKESMKGLGGALWQERFWLLTMKSLL